MIQFTLLQQVKMDNDSMNQREEDYEYIKKAKVEVIELGKEFIFGDSSSDDSFNRQLYSNSNSYIASEGSDGNRPGSNLQIEKDVGQQQKDKQSESIGQVIISELMKEKDDDHMSKEAKRRAIPNNQQHMQSIKRQNQQRQQVIEDNQQKNTQNYNHFNQHVNVAQHQNEGEHKEIPNHLQQLISVNNAKTIQYIRTLQHKIDDLSESVKEETVLRKQWTQGFSLQFDATIKQSIKQKIQECYYVSDKQQKQIKSMTTELTKKLYSTDKRLDNLDKKMDKLIQIFSSKRR